jgi:hypothetical protein
MRNQALAWLVCAPLLGGCRACVTDEALAEGAPAELSGARALTLETEPDPSSSADRLGVCAVGQQACGATCYSPSAGQTCCPDRATICGVGQSCCNHNCYQPSAGQVCCAETSTICAQGQQCCKGSCFRPSAGESCH